MLVGTPEKLHGLRPAIRRLGSITALFTYPEYLEIMPSAFDKATAARVARSFLGSPQEVRTMAIGDGMADLPLFAVVDHAVAVANAPEDVKRAATVVAPSNDDDGAAIAIEALVLGREGPRASLWDNCRPEIPKVEQKPTSFEGAYPPRNDKKN
jgi:hydroxymethylpyrimidine pyrophosphatase-like HAD family hydrolase